MTVPALSGAAVIGMPTGKGEKKRNTSVGLYISVCGVGRAPRPRSVRRSARNAMLTDVEDMEKEMLRAYSGDRAMFIYLPYVRHSGIAPSTENNPRELRCFQSHPTGEARARLRDRRAELEATTSSSLQNPLGRQLWSARTLLTSSRLSSFSNILGKKLTNKNMTFIYRQLGAFINLVDNSTSFDRKK